MADTMQSSLNVGKEIDRNVQRNIEMDFRGFQCKFYIVYVHWL